MRARMASQAARTTLGTGLIVVGFAKACIDNGRRVLRATLQRNMFVSFGSPSDLLIFVHRQQSGRPLVDLALKLNVLAAMAAFMFVGAVLLGAF